MSANVASITYQTYILRLHAYHLWIVAGEPCACKAPSQCFQSSALKIPAGRQVQPWPGGATSCRSWARDSPMHHTHYPLTTTYLLAMPQHLQHAATKPSQNSDHIESIGCTHCNAMGKSSLREVEPAPGTLACGSIHWEGLQSLENNSIPVQLGVGCIALELSRRLLAKVNSWTMMEIPCEWEYLCVCTMSQ